MGDTDAYGDSDDNDDADAIGDTEYNDDPDSNGDTYPDAPASPGTPPGGP